MKIPFRLLWRQAAAARKTVPETKASGKVLTLTAEGKAHWTGRSYVALAREGFMKNLPGHLLLSGNAYIEPLLIGGELRELHLLRPDRVSVIEGADGYEYRAGGQVRRFSVEGNGLALLHLKLFQPLDDHLGVPPLAAAHIALDLRSGGIRAAGEGHTGWHERTGGDRRFHCFDRRRGRRDCRSLWTPHGQGGDQVKLMHVAEKGVSALEITTPEKTTA